MIGLPETPEDMEEDALTEEAADEMYEQKIDNYTYDAEMADRDLLP